MGQDEMSVPALVKEFPWYAIRVRSRFEKVVAAILTGKQLESFLPTYQSSRRSALGPPSRLPLFPGYVFCRIDTTRLLPVISTPGVLSIVGVGKQPISIPDAEMADLKTVVASGGYAQPWPYLREGQQVRIRGSALDGVEGILVRFKNNLRLVVSVTLLQRSISVEIGHEHVIPVSGHGERVFMATA